MKWVFVAGLVLAVGLSVLAHVTRPVASAGGVPQLVWATDDNPARQEQMRLFRAWHFRHYGERIAIRIDQANYSREKIVIQALAGVGPDLFDFFGRANLEAYVQSGILLDVTDVAAAKGFAPERVWAGVRPSFVYEGRQYGFPDNACDFLLIYHKDVFDQAGLPYPPPDWTWQDFLRVAQRLQAARPGHVKYALLNVDPLPMLYSNGARLFSPDGTRCVLDSPEGIAALQFYYDLKYTYHVIPTASDLASQASTGGWGGGGTNLFATKYFAMKTGARYEFIAWQRDAAALRAAGQPTPLRLGVAQLPRFTVHAGRAGARTTGINRNSPRVKYALRFLEFLASPEFTRQINRSFDSLAAVQAACTGPTGIAEGPPPVPGLEAANDPLWAQAMAYAQESESSPFIPTYRVEQLFWEELGRMEAGLHPPAQTLHRFARLVNEEIARNLARDPQLRARASARSGKEPR